MRLSKIIEVKGLKLSSSFYFSDYDQFKSNKSMPKSKIFSRFKWSGFEYLVQNILVL